MNTANEKLSRLISARDEEAIVSEACSFAENEIETAFFKGFFGLINTYGIIPLGQRDPDEKVHNLLAILFHEIIEKRNNSHFDIADDLSFISNVCNKAYKRERYLTVRKFRLAHIGLTSASAMVLFLLLLICFSAYKDIEIVEYLSFFILFSYIIIGFMFNFNIFKKYSHHS